MSAYSLSYIRIRTRHDYRFILQKAFNELIDTNYELCEQKPINDLRTSKQKQRYFNYSFL